MDTSPSIDTFIIWMKIIIKIKSNNIKFYEDEIIGNKKQMFHKSSIIVLITVHDMIDVIYNLT